MRISKYDTNPIMESRKVQPAYRFQIYQYKPHTSDLSIRTDTFTKFVIDAAAEKSIPLACPLAIQTIRPLVV